MNVLVFGAGAVGELVGGRLALAGHRVWLVARPTTLEAINAQGLRLVLLEGEQTVEGLGLAETSGAAWAQGGPFDLTVLTVKSYDTATAIAALRTVPTVPIVTLQNGVGNEEALAAAFGGESVVAGAITIPVSAPVPGRVVQERVRGGVGLAGLSPQMDLRPWREAMDSAGFRIVIYADYRALKWSKLLLNLIANASAAILDLSPDAIFADAGLFRLERAALREALAVMRALGIAPVGLPGYPVQWLAWAVETLPLWLLRQLLRPLVGSSRGAKRPSLSLDLARRRSEIGWLNGAVVRYGLQVGVPTPVNAALTETLEGIVSGLLDAAHYRREPSRLLQAAGLE